MRVVVTADLYSENSFTHMIRFQFFTSVQFHRWKHQYPPLFLAAAARIPRLTLVLNTATLIITGVLGMVIGVLIMVLHQTHVDQERAKTPEAWLARD
ncbi:MAG: hypothetical protein JO151_03855, partial [Verrucomicrobia bacterium]|nr:hypothetical protein [Verrucomicrobiota bacterium]